MAPPVNPIVVVDTLLIRGVVVANDDHVGGYDPGEPFRTEASWASAAAASSFQIRAGSRVLKESGSAEFGTGAIFTVANPCTMGPSVYTLLLHRLKRPEEGSNKKRAAFRSKPWAGWSHFSYRGERRLPQ